MRSRRNLPHNQLLRDPLAHAKSIDKSGVVQSALADGGRDTILRICLAPTGRVPMRAMGYVKTAEYIGAAYFPYATQVQVVVPHRAVHSVNGVPSGQLRAAGHELFDSLFYYPRPLGTTPDKLLYAQDKAEQPYINLGRLAYLIRGAKGAAQLERQAHNRQSSHVAYVASHIRMHDITGSVEPFDPRDTTPVPTTGRLISIGAEAKERPFYEARMAARGKGGLYDGAPLAEEVGHIFTRHSLAYEPLPNADFDPHCLEFAELRSDVLADPFARRYNPVVRDLAHLALYVDTMTAEYDAFTASEQAA